MKKRLIVGTCFLFILIVLMSFASAGFFSNLFKAKITGYDIGNPSGCYNCITQSGGEWCDDGYNSFCMDYGGNDYCYGNLITNEYDCPCPTSCDDVFSCYDWQCGDCYGDGYDMPDYCYIDCGTCGAGKICDEVTHTCVLDCNPPKYEISRQVDELSETCKADASYDIGCCDPSDCVVDGECFASDTYHQPPANHLCVGASGEYCYENTWYNEKSSLPPGICINTFRWKILHRIIDPDDPDGECEEFTDERDEGCCQSDDHCVFNGYCYRSAEEKPMDGSFYFDGYYYTISSQDPPQVNPKPSTCYDVISGPGSGEFCFENVWYDEPTFANYCGNGICDSGESYLDCLDCTAPQCTENTGCTEFLCKVGTCTAAGTCAYSSNKPDDTGCGGDNICCGGSCTSPTCTSGSCDDNKECTENTCEDVGTCDAGCSYPNKAFNTPCTDPVGGVCYNEQCMAPLCNSDANCDDADSSTIDSCSNAGDYNAVCLHPSITTCTDNDDYCPVTCNSDNDNDCPLHCPDGTPNYGETCKSCPGDVSCASGEYCNRDTATCESGCINDAGCSGTTPKCDASSHTCVQCLTAAVDCGVGYGCTSGSCVLGICDYELENTGDISFPFLNRAIAKKFMKNIRTKCNAGFTINLLSALPDGYDVPTDQKIIMIFNITAIDLASGTDADLDFTINESELTIPNIENVTIYVEDNTEATEWTSLEGDIVADSTSSGMFNYKVNTPHFSLFLITEPELCGNGVFDTGYEECDGSTHCTDCVCDATFPSDGSGKCVEAITGGDCSPVGNETCTGYNLYECDSDLTWDNKGIVLGECGVECLSGEKDCDGEVSLSCGLNHKWVIQGKINGLCGYTVDPVDPDDPDDSSDRCGNGYCNYDEDENSCPEDCAEDNGKETNWFLIILIVGVAILILVIVFVLFKIFSREKGKIGLTTSNNYPTRPRPKRPPVQRSYR